MSSKQNILPVLGVLSGALVWGLIWYPYRVLQDMGVSGPLSTMLSYLLALGVGILAAPHALRGYLRAGWAAWGLLLTAGWTNFGYVLAMLEGEVMRVLLLFYLSPLWTVLFSYWLLGERLNRYGYAVIGLSLGGAAVMLWQPDSGLPLPQNRAEWLGLSAGMAFALSNVISRRAEHLRVEWKSLSVWLGTALLTLPLLGGTAAVGQIQAISAYGWLLLVLIGVALCGITFSVQYGVSHMPANRAIVLFMTELVFAAASSYLLVGEVMGPGEYAGALLLVSASLLSGKLYESH